jgi:hypothetical protein
MLNRSLNIFSTNKPYSRYCFLGVKRPDRKANESPLSTADARMRLNLPLYLHISSWSSAQVQKQPHL